MAVNAYLIIDGRPGPSTSRTDAIDIIGFTFAASQSSVIGAGSSGAESRAGRAHLANISILKVVDKVSPLLFDDCVTGNYLKKVDIIYDKPMDDRQDDYYKIHLEDAIITSIQHTGPAENLTESVTFAYSRIKVSYNPEEEGVLKGFIDKGFDVLTLKPW